jgi:hypothetical protein
MGLSATTHVAVVGDILALNVAKYLVVERVVYRNDLNLMAHLLLGGIRRAGLV